jgi:hypothetical protein
MNRLPTQALTALEKRFLDIAVRTDDGKERLDAFIKSGCAGSKRSTAPETQSHAMRLLLERPDAKRYIACQQSRRDTELAAQLHGIDGEAARTISLQEQARQAAAQSILMGLLDEQDKIKNDPTGTRSKDHLAKLANVALTHFDGKRQQQGMTAEQASAFARKMGLKPIEPTVATPATPAPEVRVTVAAAPATMPNVASLLGKKGAADGRA